MKKPAALFVISLLIITSAFAKTPKALASDAKLHQISTIAFMENKGQVHDQNQKNRPDVLYSVMAGNMVVHIKNNGVSYQLRRVDSWKEVQNMQAENKYQGAFGASVPDKQTIYRIDLNWVNANTNFTKTEDETLPGFTNYYLENCPNGVLNVKSYAGIVINNLYNGINLHYYKKNGELKHDYIVAPHADYKQIQVQVGGADIHMNEDGSLILSTQLGKVQEGAPMVFQNGKRLIARWEIKNNTLSFDIENYNPNYELIIDPVTRLWGTYYGGNGFDVASSCTTDAQGNVYVTGSTDSVNGSAIATSGSYQTTQQGGSGMPDAFLVKFNSSGQRQWGTYYGGSGYDLGNSCAVDALGNMYVAGFTDSGNGIASAGSHQPASSGGSYDAYLVKFNSSGQRQWGTYYGDAFTDYGIACATDAAGNVYLAGTTGSPYGTFIATPGSQQPTYGGGTYYDAFLVQFNSSGVRQWGTYYGGAGSETGSSCVTDASGNVYLSGSTSSSTGVVIATPASHQPVCGGGSDAFLAKFNSSGVRQWGSYYGGTGDDYGNTCAIDAANNLYVGGYAGTTTGTAIAGPGSYQATYGGGTFDAFLVKLNSSGVRQWGTYYGGPGNNDVGNSCATDASGQVYLAGYTNSNSGTAIASPGSFQPAYGGGVFDAFLVNFDSSGLRQWGTYYGGPADDYGTFCTTDAYNNEYLVGRSPSGTGTIMASPGSYQFAYGGGTYDAFLVKFSDCLLLNPIASANTNICQGTSINLSVSVSSTSSPVFNWSGPSSFTSTAQNPIIAGAGMLNTGVYTVAVIYGICVETATLQINVLSNPTVTAASDRSLICLGESTTLTAGGALSYTFNPGGSGNTLIISPTITTSYTLTGMSANNCSGTALITESVDVCMSVKNEGLTMKDSGLKIWPNPTHGILNLQLDTESEIIILDAMGQIVYAAKLQEGLNQINLEYLAKGMYVLRVWGNQGLKGVKLSRE